MKFDPGIHIAMHSVLSLKPGVTLYKISRSATGCVKIYLRYSKTWLKLDQTVVLSLSQNMQKSYMASLNLL